MNNQQVLLKSINKHSTLNNIQDYLKEVIDLRGFAKDSPEKRMLLLTEEVGELAKALRKSLKHTIDQQKVNNYSSAEEEIADVFIVLTSLCNTLKINLFDCFFDKETENSNRTWS